MADVEISSAVKENEEPIVKTEESEKPDSKVAESESATAEAQAKSPAAAVESTDHSDVKKEAAEDSAPQADESSKPEVTKPELESMEVEESKPVAESTVPTLREEEKLQEMDQSVAEEKAVATSNDSAVNDSKAKPEAKVEKKSKPDLAKMPVRNYLDSTVVPTLLIGLSTLARERPANPLEFLGNFLIEKSKETPAE